MFTNGLLKLSVCVCVTVCLLSNLFRLAWCLPSVAVYRLNETVNLHMLTKVDDEASHVKKVVNFFMGILHHGEPSSWGTLKFIIGNFKLQHGEL
ncbi:hypothetical protein Hanom_Chr04g00317801 [Helianthus anomalus]